jgi:hypothetical protein
MERLQTSEGECPSQRHVNQYLKVKPGQRAALTGFINYLKIQHTYDLKMPASPSLYAQHAKIEKQLLALMTAEAPTKNTSREWVRLGLMYFHNVATTKAREVAYAVTKSQTNYSFEVEIDGQLYWLPARLPQNEVERTLFKPT